MTFAVFHPVTDKCLDGKNEQKPRNVIFDVPLGIELKRCMTT